MAPRAMGTHGVKACVVFSRPLEDVSRYALMIAFVSQKEMTDRIS